MRDLLIVGAGGLGKEVAWIAESMNATMPEGDRWRILGFGDDNPKLAGVRVYDLPVLDAAEIDRLDPKRTWFHCAIGKNDVREQIAAKFEARGFTPATLSHPSAAVARFVTIGDGCYLAPGVVVSPGVVIGRHTIINQRASVGHDATLGEFVQQCPGAQINAFCKLERGVFVGSNASIHQGRKLGEYAVVGANSYVIRDVPAKTSVSGVPAQVLARAE